MVRLLWSGAVAALVLLAAPSVASTADAVTPPPAAGVETTPPAAVIASFRPGGRAFQEVADATSASPDGEFDPREGEDLAGVTFGMPHRLVQLMVRPAVTGTGPSFVADDLGTGSWWITVERRAGAPFGEVVTDAEGTSVSVGNGVALAEIDALPSGAIVLFDGHFGDVFAISPDLATATPLEQSAVRLVGPGAVDAPTYRAAKARQADAEAKATEGTNVPADAVGGAAGVASDGPSSIHGRFAAAAALVLVVSAAVVAWRLRSRRHTS